MPCESCQWCHVGFAEDEELAFLLPQPGTTGSGQDFRDLSSLDRVPVGFAREEQSRLLWTWLYFVA